MRPCVFAAAVGVFLTILAGCPTDLLPPGAGSSEEEEPVPASSEGEQPLSPPPPPPPPSPPPSPEQLARQALEAPTSDEQEVAAVRLAQLGKPAREHLRRVLSESQSPEVRGACIRGLAVLWDYDSMPAFLDALDDDSELVRGRAGTAVKRMMSSADYGYRSDDPPEKRAAAVKRFRAHWKEFRDSEILENWKKRLEEREQREERERREERPSAVAPGASSGTHLEPSAQP